MISILISTWSLFALGIWNGTNPLKRKWNFYSHIRFRMGLLAHFLRPHGFTYVACITMRALTCAITTENKSRSLWIRECFDAILLAGDGKSKFSEMPS